jgi:hypothetical protein
VDSTDDLANVSEVISRTKRWIKDMEKAREIWKKEIGGR